MGIELNIYFIDKGAEEHKNLVRDILNASGFNANVHPYTVQQDGIDAINGRLNSVAFLGVQGNGFETSLGDKPWATSSIDDAINQIRQNSPQAKVVVVTGGNFSREDALRAGADDYLFKPDMFTRNEYGNRPVVSTLHQLFQ